MLTELPVADIICTVCVPATQRTVLCNKRRSDEVTGKPEVAVRRYPQRRLVRCEGLDRLLSQ